MREFAAHEIVFVTKRVPARTGSSAASSKLRRTRYAVPVTHVALTAAELRRSARRHDRPMRRRDYVGPVLCVSAPPACSGARRRSRQHCGEGADGGGRGPVRPRRLRHPRSRAANSRASPVTRMDRSSVLLAAFALATLASSATAGSPPRLSSSTPARPTGQPPDGADRAGLGDQEDQGRRWHERRRLGHDGGPAQPRDLASRAGAARAGGCSCRDDATARPARASATSPAPGSPIVPARLSSCASTPTAHRLQRAWLAHPLSGAPFTGWTDDIYAAVDCSPGCAAGARAVARIPRQGHPGTCRLHGLQLGRRPGDPGRGRLHDEPDRGRALSTDAYRPAGGSRGVRGSAAVPASTARGAVDPTPLVYLAVTKFALEWRL